MPEREAEEKRSEEKRRGEERRLYNYFGCSIINYMHTLFGETHNVFIAHLEH